MSLSFRITSISTIQELVLLMFDLGGLNRRNELEKISTSIKAKHNYLLRDHHGSVVFQRCLPAEANFSRKLALVSRFK